MSCDIGELCGEITHPRVHQISSPAHLRLNLDRYNNDIAKALTAYYAGGGAVTEWANLRADCRHYVWAVYNAAVMFKEGKRPV